LRLGCRLDRIRGAGKGAEESIALGVDLDPLVRRHRFADQPPVLGENPLIARAELLEQLRRPLNVSEEEGDSARGEVVPQGLSIAPQPATFNPIRGKHL